MNIKPLFDKVVLKEAEKEVTTKSGLLIAPSAAEKPDFYTVVAVGNNSKGQCKTGDWRSIVSVAAGYEHTVGLRSDGTVVSTGDREESLVHEWKNITAIAAGHDHTVGLRKDGTVVAVGNNLRGSCNVENWKDITAIAAGYRCTAGLKKDGYV